MYAFLTQKSITCVRKENDLALDDDEYDVMLKKVIGNFKIPVAERSTVERTITDGLRKEKCCQLEIMDIDGKILLRENEMKKAVEKVIKDGNNPMIVR